MIYKAKFRFITNRTITGDYERIELSFLYSAYSFSEAEINLKDIVNRNHHPKDSPIALSMAIVKYDEIVVLNTDEVRDHEEYRFFEVTVEFIATVMEKLSKKKKRFLIQEYNMDAAKAKAKDHAKMEREILFDDYEVKKVSETDLYEIYI